jgi:BTB/POZ domain
MQVGSSEIHAHRIVLASASPYLHEMFAADDENKSAARENVITYRLNGGIDKTAFERLIDFAYTSRLAHSSLNDLFCLALTVCFSFFVNLQTSRASGSGQVGLSGRLPAQDGQSRAGVQPVPDPAPQRQELHRDSIPARNQQEQESRRQG